MYRPVLLSALIGLALSAHAQKVYELTAPATPKAIRSDHLRMGGTSPQGGSIAVNNSYMSIDGRPVIPVMGEFHYSRYPREQWEEEILKMKAGGVTVLPTYVFWSLHEEVEGQFRWDGQRDLRHFLELCKKHQMPVVIRIGPFCHGEIRSGGFPDWLFAKPLEVRSNDPEYLKLVRRFYHEIGKQMQGLNYKDGGPVIGCQVENEMQHSAAPWAICYPGEQNDYTAASYNAGEANIGVEVQTRKATVLPAGDGASLLCLGQNTIDYIVYPSKQGFKPQTATVDAVSPQFEVKKAGPRRMSVSFQADDASQVQEYFLRINYVGDVAMAFMKGQLVQDEFYHGAPWTIGLKRYYTDLRTDPLTFYFRPLRNDVPYLRDLPREAIPDFANGPVVDIKQVEIVPEYKIHIKF